jgi:uncharacterized membrane protein YqiK
VTDSQLIIVTIAASVVGMFVVAVVIAKRCWHAVPPGQALIINRAQGEPRVSLTGAFVMPVFHRAERIDLGVRQIEIDRRGRDGVTCLDGIRADIKVTFQVHVNRTADDILEVARSIGCARAADPATLGDLFTAKFSEAIKTIGATLEFEQLSTRRQELKDQIISVIGHDLNGYVLEDAAIDYLEQTPLECLDPNNILDARGIKKILASSKGIDELRHQQRSRETTAALRAASTSTALQDEFEQLGLRDVRVTTEVSCDVALGRANLSATLGGDPGETGTRLPSSVPRTVIAAIGRGELTCGGGRATLRWLQTHVTADQLIAGARLVHALREDDHAYR